MSTLLPYLYCNMILTLSSYYANTTHFNTLLPYRYRNIILTLVSPCINPTLINERTVSSSDRSALPLP